jgi:hypothetical protein
MFGKTTLLHVTNLIIFPLHLQKINDVVMWVRETICNHQVVVVEPIDENLVGTFQFCQASQH